MMRVKVDDKWYDAQAHPICIQYNDGERKQIADNPGPERKYAQFPDDWGSPDEMRAWMSDLGDFRPRSDKNTSFSRPEDLLKRALADLRGELTSMVECCCELAWDGMDHVPVPGTASPETIPAIADRVLLIREIEAEIRRPAEHPEPQWLDDLIDGKWGLS